jgi:hypothetical protein
MKKVVVILLMLMAGTAVYAQEVDSFIELLRSDVKTEKKAIITEAMQFSDQEAAAFWPVYRNFEFELDKLGDAKLALIKAYAENYDTMTDAKAKELVDKTFKFQEQRLSVKKKYFNEFSKVLSPTTAAKFMQLDNQMQLLIDLQIATELPLAKKPGSKQN